MHKIQTQKNKTKKQNLKNKFYQSLLSKQGKYNKYRCLIKVQIVNINHDYLFHKINLFKIFHKVQINKQIIKIFKKVFWKLQINCQCK